MGRLPRAACGCWLLIVVSASAFVLPERVSAQDQKQVLVYSTRRDARIVTVGDRELPRILNDGHPDGSTTPSSSIKPGCRTRTTSVPAISFGSAYSGHTFDLVMAMDDNALAFVERTRQELFPATPSCSSRSARRRAASSFDRHHRRARPGGDARLGQQAAARSPARVRRQRRRNDEQHQRAGRAGAVRQFEPRRGHALTGLPTKDLEARLSALPTRSSCIT